VPQYYTVDQTLDIQVHFIRHPRARRYVIRVRPDGTVRVTVPRWGSIRQAEAFARQQWSWIERQHGRFVRNQDSQTRVLSDQELSALKARAKRELPDELRRVAAVHGLAVLRVSVRNQRGRWGSCSPKGHISLNWRLVLMPAAVREYVLIHELMHLRRLDHSPAFWGLVAAACPHYQDSRRWLRQNGQLLNHPING
jgi:predicted metal-dependent hydrolase